jgi:hypothetical protein
MWPFKKPTVHVPDDVPEAQEMRSQAQKQLRAVTRRGPDVSQLVDYLAERRAQNHFGESITISFTRRTSG